MKENIWLHISSPCVFSNQLTETYQEVEEKNKALGIPVAVEGVCRVRKAEMAF